MTHCPTRPSRASAVTCHHAMLALLLLVYGCSSSAGAPPADGPAGATDGGGEAGPLDGGARDRGEASGDAAGPLPAHCNPLSGDHCLLPWPSSFYLKQDPTTKTGYRVSYPAAAMPRTGAGVPVDPVPLNRLDGFSTGSQPLVTFASGVSAKGLPGLDDPEAGTGDASLIWLLEWSSKRRVPLFAELDANAEEGEQQALIIRPLQPLVHDERYVVVLRKGLLAADGSTLVAPEPFRRVRDGEALDGGSTLAGEAKRLAPVLALLRDEAKLALDEVVLAWDFHTTSEEAVTSDLLRMVDEALTKLPADGPAYEVLEVIEHPEDKRPNLWFEIRGEMEVPSYLDSDSDDAWLNRDSSGKPQFRAMQRFGFRVTIPRCAATATAPLPVVIYGHGQFGSDEAITWGQRRQMFNRLCVVAAATDWRGFSDKDKGPVAVTVIPNFSNMPRVTEPLQQAHVNFQVLAELMQGKLLADDALKVKGEPVTDGKQLYYIGISLGGIQGTTFAALSKRIARYVLNVPGGWYGQMIQRAQGFREFGQLARVYYDAPLDLLIAIHVAQSLFDYSDPISYAHKVIKAPFPGREPKRILFQEALWDEAVPNIATRAIARALGLPLLEKPYEPVFGIEQKGGPLPSAYVQWETAPGQMPPEGNLTAPKLQSKDSPHEQVRRTESCLQQIEKFLTPDGLVHNTCGTSHCTTKQ